MKQLLIIDESPLFREYLRERLDGKQIEASSARNALDGISKIWTHVPDLIIMDYHLKSPGYLEVLKQKKANVNTANTPVIMMAQHIDQKRIIELVPYNVRKVLTKPLKLDALFASLTEILGIPFEIDETPGVVEVHVNDNIIFVEIAQGLNRDKLDLLHFKILELINLYGIRNPQVIVMLSDMTMSFADSPNLQKLLDVVIKSSKAKLQDIRILTLDAFARKFIEERPEYAGLEVVSNLQYALDGLITELDDAAELEEEVAELIGDRILSAAKSAPGESMQLRFEAESKPDLEIFKDSIGNLKIAVVDDDFVIQELLKNTFRRFGTRVNVYSDGSEFLKDLMVDNFDLVFLDLLMPNVDGFEVLNAMKIMDMPQSVIVISAVSRRETVIRAFKLGIKSYIIKPLKPDDIIKKALEILRPNF
jgi:DNA-binding response OmpR family regulator